MFNFNLFSGIPNFRPFQGKINCCLKNCIVLEVGVRGGVYKRGEGSGDVDLSFQGLKNRRFLNVFFNVSARICRFFSKSWL